MTTMILKDNTQYSSSDNFEEYLSFNNIEIDYNSLPVKKVSNKAAVFHDAPASIKM